MAHSVGSTTFRVGNNKVFWTFSWVANRKVYLNYFHKDLFAISFFKSFFLRYTIPLFSRINLRNKSKNNQQQRTGKENIIDNPFVELNLIFSHLSINRYDILIFDIYIFDTYLEEWRNDIIRGNTSKGYMFFHPITDKDKKSNSISFFKSKEEPNKKETDQYLNLKASITRKALDSNEVTLN